MTLMSCWLAMCLQRCSNAPPSPQVFLIIHYQPLVNSLADVILNGDLSVFSLQAEQDVQKSSVSPSRRPAVRPSVAPE